MKKRKWKRRKDGIRQRYWYGRKRRKRKVSMAFTKVKKVTTPKYVAFYGIDEPKPGEEDYTFNVSNVTFNIPALMSYKNLALGKEKNPKDEDREKFSWYKKMSDKEFKARQAENQAYAKKQYAEGIRLEKLRKQNKIQPTEIVRLMEREIRHMGVSEKGEKDWGKELEEQLDLPFVKKLEELSAKLEKRKPELKVEDYPEFIGLTPDQAHKKAFPPRQIVAPEDPFILLKPAIYNKLGKKGDFQIRGKGPVGTIKEIKNRFPGKKIKIDWGTYTEEL